MIGYKLNKDLTPKILKDYGFKYRENGDYCYSFPCYKWNGIPTIYGYITINIEENALVYDVKSDGTTYYPYYNGTKPYEKINSIIRQNIKLEINKLVKKDIIYEDKRKKTRRKRNNANTR